MSQHTSERERASLDALQSEIRYKFKNLSLLLQALTHTSWSNENNIAGFHNERLEFLGDAVLELCITEELFRRFPDAREGSLTDLRSQLVNESVLASLASGIGINKCLRLGRGEENQGGRCRPAVLADAFEALLGAIYEDSGIEAAKQVIADAYADKWPESPVQTRAKDPKTLLLEYCQRQFHEPPVYSVLSARGPGHERTFEVEAQMPDGSKARASGASTKKAEQAAALAALVLLGKESV